MSCLSGTPRKKAIRRPTASIPYVVVAMRLQARGSDLSEVLRRTIVKLPSESCLYCVKELESDENFKK